MNENQKNFITGLLFLVVGIVIRIFVIPNQASNTNAYGLPSSFFPNVVAYIIIVLSIILIAKSIIKGRSEILKSFNTLIITIIKKENLISFRNALVIFLICLAYFISLKFLPFIYVTPITIILISLFFGWRRWIILILTAIIVTFAIKFLFESIMKILLP